MNDQPDSENRKSSLQNLLTKREPTTSIVFHEESDERLPPNLWELAMSLSASTGWITLYSPTTSEWRNDKLTTK